jgi:hypothetical protein
MRLRDNFAPAVQGSVYVASGLWPIIHLRSFERVTGPKHDDWLVKTVGGLLAVIGLVLLANGVRKRPSRWLRALGLGTAGVLVSADVVYAGSGRISKIYLGDALLHALLAGAWLAVRPAR